MKRSLPGLLVLTGTLVLLSFAVPAAGVEASTNLTIGQVRGDSLYVDRSRVVAAALMRNEMLAASSAMSDAAAADALGAWRGFLPQVQLSEFFVRSDDALSSFGFKLQNRGVTPLDFGMGPAGFISGNINEPGETNNFITRVQLLQPLFNGGMGIYGKQAADAASRAAAFEHRRAAETVGFHAVQAFEGLVLAAAYEDVMMAAVISAEAHVRQARSMVEAEMATEADLLRARVYLSAIRQQLIEVRNMVAVAGEHIKLLTAVDTPLPLAADTRLAADLDLPESCDTAGIDQRNDLRAGREQASAAGKMVGVARGAVLPHVNLSLQKDWYDRESLFGTNADAWTVGVYATMGFGVQNVGEIRKAKAQRRAAEHMADFRTRQARVEATEAWLAARAAAEKVRVAEDAVGAAREGLRIVTNQYREGLATMVNLLDTQAAATMAEGNLVQALHDFNVGRANFEYSRGGACRISENREEASHGED
ncbi:MAG: TolC family protein [bacterium]|nr:TolC family protein [bacterium]